MVSVFLLLLSFIKREGRERRERESRRSREDEEDDRDNDGNDDDGRMWTTNRYSRREKLK
ncbi:hypothetical protein BCD_1119 (plasmid) [Borrelia crocidurae DOU]|uniref:Uncharacterized protein n=1 Tax=Borrelia crocidurae DOU TaxID=1293575 RepID=W5SJU6_9SPIR|nr:hypothetical protein BCD_1119 [Borrelia crocidurae DOU]